MAANQDDGVEWFGGTVNTSNVITWNVGDDGIDTDQLMGQVRFTPAVLAATGHAFELDGPQGSFRQGI
ncbi:MAG: hypothetical protein U5L96_19345 [Owenweeksia sp.]|nr:hypothetical protein [Owenweeksia sp.]